MSSEDFTQQSEQLQELLGINSGLAGRASGFVARASKLTAAVFVKTLVLGYLEKGAASLNEWVGVAKELGVAVSGSSLAQRMNERGVALLKQWVAEQVQAWGIHSAATIGVLGGFSAVNIVDSTQISMPAGCQMALAGSGGSASPAGVKVQVSYEYLSGSFNAIEVGSARVPNQSSPLPQTCATVNSLTLMDLGYFKQATLLAIDHAAAFFLTRLHTQVNLYWHADDATKADVVGFLKRQPHTSGELTVYLGAEARLPVRLVYRQRPPDSVGQQRQRALRNAKKKKRTCSQTHLDWLAWQVCITNLPADRY